MTNRLAWFCILLLIFFTVKHSSKIRTTTTAVAATSSTTVPVSDAESAKLDMYRRFEHTPPRTRTPIDRETCGEAPQYLQYFQGSQQTNRSANDEDRVIFNHFFKNITKDAPGHRPTYLELGAYNGKTESNSRFFDVCLGWEGVLVEPNPNPVVKERLIRNRPTSHRLHFAASCSHHAALHENATAPFYAVMWTNAAQETGKSKNAYTGKKQLVDVPCGSLTPVIQDLLGGRVTFMSLDVEGAEPLVLEQMDFDKVFVDVMIVENRNNFCLDKCESRDKFRAILDNAGYIRPQTQFVIKSDLYVHPKSPFAKLVS